MNRKITYLIGVLLSLTFLSALSQEQIAVVGRICDAETGEPLPFVNVSVQGTVKGTTSDFDGVFNLDVDKGSLIQISYVAYDKYEFRANGRLADTVQVKLKATELVLDQLTVKPGVNPAIAMLDSIVANRPRNDLHQQPYWERDIYNKLEIDIKNIKRSEKDRKWMRQFDFIFNYVDTLEGSNETFLPVYFSENVSKVVHKNGVGDAERILATNSSGFKHPMVTEFTSSLYLDFNPYENSVSISNVAFILPINGQGRLFYRYYVRDSIEAPTGKQYIVSFIPRNEEDRVFRGIMVIDKATWSLVRIEMKLSPKANVNFMSQLSVTKEYALEDDLWLLKNDSVYTEVFIQKNQNDEQIGLIGRKSTWYKNYSLHEKENEKIRYGQVTVAPDAFESRPEFWDEIRPEPLEEYEQTVYLLADSINNLPIFKSVTEYLHILFMGYKDLGKFELGPYFYLYSKNQIEGHRFRVGGRSTIDLYKNTRLRGYVAYGTKDQEFKYGFGVRLFLQKRAIAQCWI